MNGAESLVRTLSGAGVEVCFANPGTSEMHFVAALDLVGGVRCVLGLFEGVVTGAADGYARMADRPAATLLHLGPGLANGLANLHNAKRASSPVVNIVGDHATYHKEYDAPLTSDVEGVARPFSDWVLTSKDSSSVAPDAATAIATAMSPPGRIATLILPADASWGIADGPAPLPPVETRAEVSPGAVAEAARALRHSGETSVLFLGGLALREPGLTLAGRIAASTGARLIAQTHNARVERGAGRLAVDFLPYPVDAALKSLAGTSHLLLAGSKAPVAFFAYPDKPSTLAPPECEVHALATPAEDVVRALTALADELDAHEDAPVQQRETLSPPGGAVSPDAAAISVAAMLPENAIVVEEALTAAGAFMSRTRGAAPHDYLQITGGAIGIGPPLATGAAVACPGRKVVCLQADGSAMYTVQALWTQAREGLDVTTVILNNRSYAILKGELANVGARNAGRTANAMMELDRPALDWISLARGMGVKAGSASTMEEFNSELEAGLLSEGPYLIDLQL